MHFLVLYGFEERFHVGVVVRIPVLDMLICISAARNGRHRTRRDLVIGELSIDEMPTDTHVSLDTRLFLPSTAESFVELDE